MTRLPNRRLLAIALASTKVSYSYPSARIRAVQSVHPYPPGG